MQHARKRRKEKGSMEEVAHSVDLNGEFRFKVDAKGRISLPSKFRRVLSEDLVVTIDPYSECLLVFEPKGFDEWVSRVFNDRFGGYNASDRKHSQLRRELKRRARDVQVDTAGRIMLAADQRDAVGIKKDVAIIGNTGYFEVWDAKRSDQASSDVDLGELFG